LDCLYCRSGLEQGETGRDIFIRILDGLLHITISLLHNETDVISDNPDRRRTYIASILRFDVEGMGDVGPGKFLLITVSGSLRGDKLLYDEIVCA